MKNVYFKYQDYPSVVEDLLKDKLSKQYVIEKFNDMDNDEKIVDKKT